METNVYFKDIHTHIIRELEQAESGITIAVAWFTDKDLFDVLCKKASNGISVKLLITDDHINRKKSGVDHQRLIDSGGDVFWDNKTTSNIMHHKFCVIDSRNVITGSYNWTLRARGNNEDIMIVSGAGELAFQFLETFNDLLKANGLAVKSIPRLDTEAIAKRLDLVSNLIDLHDFDDIPTQIKKLERMPGNPQLVVIIELLVQQEFTAADDHIRAYVKQLRAMIPFRDAKVEQLRQELLTLEFQINALSDQKIECEVLIGGFLHRHHGFLGELILEYLSVKMELVARGLEDIADDDGVSEEEKRRATEEMEEAENDYTDYSERYRQIEEDTPPPPISAEDKNKIKKLYKKASMLCHPDRVDEKQKDKASEIFQRLEKAYRDNDLEGVEAIHLSLTTGASLGDRAMGLSDRERLESAVEELRTKVGKIRGELNTLMAGETWNTLSSVDDWDEYFKGHQAQLKKQIEEIKLKLEADNG
jgi:hypothetical protein